MRMRGGCACAPPQDSPLSQLLTPCQRPSSHCRDWLQGSPSLWRGGLARISSLGTCAMRCQVTRVSEMHRPLIFIQMGTRLVQQAAARGGSQRCALLRLCLSDHGFSQSQHGPGSPKISERSGNRPTASSPCSGRKWHLHICPRYWEFQPITKHTATGIAQAIVLPLSSSHLALVGASPVP